MLLIARVTVFTVHELLRENQEGVEKLGLKIDVRKAKNFYVL